jgi:endonuclease/exonuclease/phosphatase (EEP) superfamily protein YafD
MNIVLIPLAWIFIVATGMSLIPLNDWWIRAFDFPRLQIFIGGFIVLVVFLLLVRKINLIALATLIGLVICLSYQGVKIYPYTPIAGKQVLSEQADTDAQLTLLIANVLMENRQSQKLLQIIREADPDVLLLVEVNARWDEQLRQLENEYSYVVKQVQENHYGMVLYSRLELVEPQIRFLVSDEIPSIHTQVVMRSGDLIWLHGLHPEPPSPTGAEESTQRDAELLIVGKEVKQRDEPAIVAGDLNDVAWSHTTSLFQKASGLLDPRVGRGMYNSYNAKNILMRWPLDHVFHSNHFLLNALARMPAFGSDHFPMYIGLHLAPQAESVQEEPELDAGDVEEVEETIDQVQ